MLVGNKWFYIILSTLGLFLIAFNVIVWSMQDGTGVFMVFKPVVNDPVDTNNFFTPRQWYGFKDFYRQLSTFPGPAFSYATLTGWSNVITNFEVIDLGNMEILEKLLNGLLALVRLLTAPIVLAFAMVGDLLSNIIWFFMMIFGKL